MLDGESLRNEGLNLNILARDVPLLERGFGKIDGAFLSDCRDLAHHPAQRDVGQHGVRLLSAIVNVLRGSPANICGIKEVIRERFAFGHRSNSRPPLPEMEDTPKWGAYLNGNLRTTPQGGLS